MGRRTHRLGGPRFAWDDNNPYNSAHSQKIEFLRGDGTAGVANRGLNRWGLSVRDGRTYAGRLYLRQASYDGKVTVALQSADGARTYAKQEVGPVGKDWARYDFSLKATADDANARFAVWIDKPGAVWVDQVYLSGTGDDLFHGLPMRADVGKMLVDEGLGVLRYGGSMVNAPEYRWKKMIGDRDRRPQYKGWWYPHSTNGFGIEDFVQFCRAAGFEPVFAINDEDTPEDAADLVEYLNGPATSEWGKRRAANGHPDLMGSAISRSATRRRPTPTTSSASSCFPTPCTRATPTCSSSSPRGGSRTTPCRNDRPGAGRQGGAVGRSRRRRRSA